MTGNKQMDMQENTTLSANDRALFVVGAFSDSLEMTRRKSAPLATQTYSMKMEPAL
jgi:hypothetical protein